MRTLKSFIFGIFVVAFSLYSCSPENPPQPTPTSVEIISTPTGYNHTFTTIELEGKVTPPQGTQITERGLSWSTSPNPTVSDNKKVANQNTFTLEVDGLTANTLYYFRAYAMTASGITYSQEETFTTSTLDGTLWDFYIKLTYTNNEFSDWHADVLFKADGTTVYDEPNYPGLYTEYGDWSLNGNTVTYLMTSGTNGDNYLFTGTLVENTMSGTFTWADPNVTTYFDATMYP